MTTTTAPTTVLPIQPTAEHRAALVAGLRALARFLEDRPDIPCPFSVRAQHSVIAPYDDGYRQVPMSADAKAAYVRQIAARFPELPDINDTAATFEHPFGGEVAYVVHANLRTATGGPEATA
jgi:hypothetical protein